jgi:KaiC/GvpD/RAD55 family RecA-like ATPase
VDLAGVFEDVRLAEHLGFLAGVARQARLGCLVTDGPFAAPGVAVQARAHAADCVLELQVIETGEGPARRASVRKATGTASAMEWRRFRIDACGMRVESRSEGTTT